MLLLSLIDAVDLFDNSLLVCFFGDLLLLWLLLLLLFLFLRPVAAANGRTDASGVALTAAFAAFLETVAGSGTVSLDNFSVL